MKKKFYPALMAAIVLLACSKSEDAATASNNNNTPGTGTSGPWDGTYKMVSYRNIQSDTLDATPYGGSTTYFYLDTFSASGMNAKLTVTKDKFTLEQLGYTVNRNNTTKEYNATTGVTKTSRYSSSSVTAGDNYTSGYTIAGSDSVAIAEPVLIAKVTSGRINANNKVRYAYAGSTLTFYNDYYESKVVATGSQNMRVKTRSTIVTVYQKQ